MNNELALELARKYLDKGISWEPRITRCTDAEILNLIKAVESAQGVCQWTQDDDWENSSDYKTECGDSFSITEDTPLHHGMKFCCYCGKRLVQVLFESKD